MNENVFERVLHEILEEMQQANKGLKEMKGVVSGLEGRINALDGRVGQFEQQLKEQQVIAPPADVQPVKQAVEGALELFRSQQAESVQRMTAIVEAQPKNVVKQWRLSFFPADDREGSFKHFIDRLARTAIVGMVVVTLFIFGTRWLNRYYAFRADYERLHPVQAILSESGGEPGASSPSSPGKEKGMLRTHRRHGEMHGHGQPRGDTLDKNNMHPNSDSSIHSNQ